MSCYVLQTPLRWDGLGLAFWNHWLIFQSFAFEEFGVRWLFCFFQSEEVQRFVAFLSAWHDSEIFSMSSRSGCFEVIAQESPGPPTACSDEGSPLGNEPSSAYSTQILPDWSTSSTRNRCVWVVYQRTTFFSSLVAGINYKTKHISDSKSSLVRPQSLWLRG